MNQKLSKLRPGDQAIIKEVEFKRGLSSRLIEMGFYPGKKIVMCRIALFGSPLEIDIGYNILLRKSEADYIHVDKIEENKAEKDNYQ